MLSNLEIATVRASLRFWLDEIASDHASVAMPYFDCPIDAVMDRQGMLSLISRFETSRVRFVVADGTGRIVVDRLLLSAELGDLQIAESDSRQIHTVLVVAG